MTTQDFFVQTAMAAIGSLLFKKKSERFAIWFNGLNLTTAQGIALGIMIFTVPCLLMVFAVKAGWL